MLLLFKNRMNERVIFGHNPLDQSTLKLLVFFVEVEPNDRCKN